jgi:hypothetical protein
MSERIILGSTAAKHWYPDFREPKDLDVITQQPEPRVKGVDAHSHQLITENWSLLSGYVSDEGFASPNLLYTWKMSHSYWDVHWNKTTHDIIWLKKKGCRVIQPIHDVLYKVWEDVHGKKRANLNVTNEQFFTKTVKRVYDHDMLHEAMKFSDRPMYEQLKKDPNRAWICKSMWDELSTELKRQTVLEEAYVIALERFVIPGKMNHRQAYLASLKLLVTNLSKGWFPQFIVDNLGEFRQCQLDSKFLSFRGNGE